MTAQVPLEFTRLDAELYLVGRLKQHGAHVFDGDTTTATRKERIRAAILEHGLDCTIVGRNKAGKTDTYRACYERLYGEPL